MRRLLKDSSMSALLILLAAFTFSACSNHKNNTKTPQAKRQAYNNRSPNNMNRSSNNVNRSSNNMNQSANNNRTDNNKNEMLLGEVINAQTGEAVANAKVTIKLSGNDNHAQNNNMSGGTTVTTNRNGLFMETNIAKGDHVIRVEQNGYQPWENTIYVPTLNKNNAAGPFNGLFMPSENSNGWLHGVFQTSDNNNHPSNMYAKSLFVTIGLQRK